MLVFYFYYKIILNIYYVSFLLGLSIFKADMKSYILLQTAAVFFSIEHISKTGYWLGVCPTDFNSSLPCFPTNCSKCCSIETLFQHVPHVESTFKYINTFAYVFCWSVLRASYSCFSIKLVMFHKKRDQSLLTVKISTFNFTTGCFVSKQCIYQINYH